MNNMAKALSYLMAANFQVGGIFILAAVGADELDLKYPQKFDWIMVTMPLGLVVSAHIFYVIIRRVVQMDREASAKRKLKK